MTTREQFVDALARMQTVLASRFMTTNSMDARLLVRSASESITYIAADPELVGAALASLNGEAE